LAFFFQFCWSLIPSKFTCSVANAPRLRKMCMGSSFIIFSMILSQPTIKYVKYKINWNFNCTLSNMLFEKKKKKSRKQRKSYSSFVFQPPHLFEGSIWFCTSSYFIPKNHTPMNPPVSSHTTYQGKHSTIFALIFLLVQTHAPYHIIMESPSKKVQYYRCHPTYSRSHQMVSMMAHYVLIHNVQT